MKLVAGAVASLLMFASPPGWAEKYIPADAEWMPGVTQYALQPSGPTPSAGFQVVPWRGASPARRAALRRRVNLSGLAISWLAGEQARTYRDWGTPGVGSDNVYGTGPCHIIDFVANTTWVAKNHGNLSNQPNGPYYTILAGHNVVPPGGRLLVFPGGSYPENITFSRVMRVETLTNPAIIGQ
jgi:hypothetical protein